MQLIVLSKKGKKALNIAITRQSVLLVLSMLLLSLGLGFYALQAPNLASTERLQINNVLNQQSQELARLKQSTRNQLDGLAVRVAQVQARLMRLNAVGEHLVKKAKINPSEFNFNGSVGLGGLQETGVSSALSESQLMSDIEKLNEQMDLREVQISLLDQFMLDKELAKKVRPAGLPVQKGWLSSHFGYRIDPFNGRKAFHYGVDVAGKSGTHVLSVASGIISFVGVKSGYGVFIEIEHGNGYVTRYAHNKTALVKVGDMVEQGAVIAKMGSTGRSTGPHVHFEVLLNGKKVNPKKYLYSSR